MLVGTRGQGGATLRRELASRPRHMLPKKPALPTEPIEAWACTHRCTVPKEHRAGSPQSRDRVLHLPLLLPPPIQTPNAWGLS